MRFESKPATGTSIPQSRSRVTARSRKPSFSQLFVNVRTWCLQWSFPDAIQRFRDSSNALRRKKKWFVSLGTGGVP